MKELVELLWRSLATYVPILVAVVTAPRTTILARIAEPEGRFPRALSFVGVTVAIGFLLQAPLAKDGSELASVAGSMIAFKVIAILLFAGIITLSFRIVGGSGSFETTLSAYLYSVSPVYLFLVVLEMMTRGALDRFDPEVALTWAATRSLPDESIDAMLAATPGLAATVTILMLVQIVGMVAWLLVCWRVYRTIHEVSAFRSAVAYVLAFVAVVLSAPLLRLIIDGIHGGKMPAIS